MTRAQPAFVLNEFLPYRLVTAGARISRAFERRYSVEAGVSLAEWRVLALLSQQGEVSVREIEAGAEMEKSKVSRAATRLEEQGLIAKMTNPDDRRLVSLSLTDAGWELMGRLIPLANTFQKDLLALIGSSNAGLDQALKAIMKARV